jgi:hypothetical protein
MLVQIEPNLIVNTDKIEYISKLTDNKVCIDFASGSSKYIHRPLSEVMALLSPQSAQLLSETCA